MNDHSLDDLIIGEPLSSEKKSKGILAIVALIVIVLLAGILLSKMILGTSDSNQTATDKNETEFVSPDLIPMDKKASNQADNLAPIVKERVPSSSDPKTKKVSTPKQTQPKKVNIETKKPIATSKVKQVKAPVKKKPKLDTKQTAKKKQTKPTELFKGGSPKYFIQVGAFNREPNPKFLKKIEDGGFKYVVNVNDKTRRVRIGPYSSYAEAKAALSDVNSSIGIAGFVVKQKQ